MLNQRRVVLVLVLTVSMQSMASAAHGPYRVHCAPGMPCVPERITYGYFPTSWRRWPTDSVTSPTAAQQPEALPTPAKEPTKAPTDGGPSTPGLIEEDTLTPSAPGTTSPPAATTPSFDAPPTPPFDTTPSATPPVEEFMPSPTEPPAATPPAETPPADKTEAPAATPESNSKPPASDEDPFKDDPDSMGLPSADSIPSSGPTEVYYEPDAPATRQAIGQWRNPGMPPARPATSAPAAPKAVSRVTTPPVRESKPLARGVEPGRGYPVTQAAAQAPRSKSKAAATDRTTIAATAVSSNSGNWRPNPLRTRE